MSPVRLRDLRPCPAGFPMRRLVLRLPTASLIAALDYLGVFFRGLRRAQMSA